MSRPKNRPWVPRLRFPEFRDAGAWEAKEIQECLEYERPDRFIVNSDNYHQSGTPVLTANQSFILGYTNEHDGICNHLPAVIFDDFTTDMKYVDFPFKVKSSAIKILRTKEDNNLSFLYELIYRMPFDASQHKRHYISEYQHQVIRLPHPREQNKIAACLSSLDALITTLSRKIDTLKEHKKGLMQQLFPQEGETVPQLRFPEFRDAGAWEAKEIQECLEYERPDRFIVNSDNYHQSGTPVLTANQSFILGYTNEHDGICNHLPAVIFDDFTTDMKYVDFPFKVKSSAIKILRTKEDNNLSFLYELIYRMPFDASQHKRHYISEYQHQVIRLPHPREQNKIAACLSSLDELISAQSQRLDSIKTHKKGLMQQLFPTVAESTP
ncbi:MAG: restriction endonuclease subunit S [Gammaproteobacteria bacterium]|nr:restriction endonuclease subunit S [Gammaproteobacteria bacterium]